jgi:uncharacterized membrane protein
MCFNRKVLGGLAVVAVGVLLVAPRLFAGVLPLLVVAACPLGMVLMMRGMSGANRTGQSSTAAGGADPAGADVAAEIARLKSEVARLRAEGADTSSTEPQPAPPPVSPPRS